MGYLDKYLRNNPRQIVDCNDLYNLWLSVEHPIGIDQITTGDSDIKVSLFIKDIVPDVEDWQYGGDTGTRYIFKFHRDSDRAQAIAYLSTFGYTTHKRDFRKR